MELVLFPVTHINTPPHEADCLFVQYSMEWIELNYSSIRFWDIIVYTIYIRVCVYRKGSASELRRIEHSALHFGRHPAEGWFVGPPRLNFLCSCFFSLYYTLCMYALLSTKQNKPSRKQAHIIKHTHTEERRLFLVMNGRRNSLQCSCRIPARLVICVMR